MRIIKEGRLLEEKINKCVLCKTIFVYTEEDIERIPGRITNYEYLICPFCGVKLGRNGEEKKLPHYLK